MTARNKAQPKDEASTNKATQLAKSKLVPDDGTTENEKKSAPPLTPTDRRPGDGCRQALTAEKGTANSLVTETLVYGEALYGTLSPPDWTWL